jgi:hypothetical protein
MTTPWTLPNTFYQYAEPGAETAHISWNDLGNFQNLLDSGVRSIETLGALEHIARSPKHDIRNKTYYLRATNFTFTNLPNTVSGVELRISSRRYGRATDESICLCYNDKDIGINRATLDLNPIKIYGSNSDLWDVESITSAMVQDPSFGVIIRFQAHPHWPHRSPVIVDSVELRIH